MSPPTAGARGSLPRSIRYCPTHRILGRTVFADSRVCSVAASSDQVRISNCQRFPNGAVRKFRPGKKPPWGFIFLLIRSTNIASLLSEMKIRPIAEFGEFRVGSNVVRRRNYFLGSGSLEQERKSVLHFSGLKTDRWALNALSGQTRTTNIRRTWSMMQ